MKVRIENEGTQHPVTVVIDADYASGVALDPGAAGVFVTDEFGVIELHEFPEASEPLRTARK